MKENLIKEIYNNLTPKQTKNFNQYIKANYDSATEDDIIKCFKEFFEIGFVNYIFEKTKNKYK